MQPLHSSKSISITHPRILQSHVFITCLLCKSHTRMDNRLMNICQYYYIHKAADSCHPRKLRIDFNAIFSSRLTCACEMPISAAVSICVLHSKKRIVIILFSRGESFSTASLREIRLTQFSSQSFLSLTWSST